MDYLDDCEDAVNLPPNARGIPYDTWLRRQILSKRPLCDPAEMRAWIEWRSSAPKGEVWDYAAWKDGSLVAKRAPVAVKGKKR